MSSAGKWKPQRSQSHHVDSHVVSLDLSLEFWLSLLFSPVPKDAFIHDSGLNGKSNQWSFGELIDVHTRTEDQNQVRINREGSGGGTKGTFGDPENLIKNMCSKQPSEALWGLRPSMFETAQKSAAAAPKIFLVLVGHLKPCEGKLSQDTNVTFQGNSKDFFNIDSIDLFCAGAFCLVIIYSCYYCGLWSSCKCLVLSWSLSLTEENISRLVLQNLNYGLIILDCK